MFSTPGAAAGGVILVDDVDGNNCVRLPGVVDDRSIAVDDGTTTTSGWGGVPVGEWAMGVLSGGVLLNGVLSAGVLLGVLLPVAAEPGADSNGEPPRRLAAQLPGGEDDGTRGPRRLLSLLWENDLGAQPGEGPLLLSGRGRLCTEGALDEFADAAGVALEDAAAGLEAGLAVGGGIEISDGTDTDVLGLWEVKR